MKTRTITQRNLDAAAELAKAVLTAPAPSGWRIQGAKDLPSMTLTVADTWRNHPDAVLDRPKFEQLLYHFIRESLWFENWIAAANSLTDSEHDRWFPKSLSKDSFIGLDAMSSFIQREALGEIDWWKHPSESKQYAFRIDFEAALSLSLVRLSLLSPQSSSVKESARAFVDDRHNYLKKWLKLAKSGGKATEHAKARLQSALAWDLFVVPMKFFSDSGAANLLNELGVNAAKSAYRDSIRGRHGLRLTPDSKPIVTRWDTRQSKPAGKLKIRISRSNTRTHDLDPLEIHTLLETRFPDRQIVIR